MQWLVIFKKEMLENARNFKWIWLPFVFILLACMDPLTYYYLPQIIDMTSTVPEGAQFTVPDFSESEVIQMSLSEMSMMGVLVLALASMRTIAGEFKSGVTELILVKPVSFANYITAKWASMSLLTLCSVGIGLVGSWYYVNLLFGQLAFTMLIKIIFFFGLWILLVMSISIFYNVLLKTPGIVAFLTIATVAIMSLLTSAFGHIITWSPNNISDYISDMIDSGSIPSELWGASLVTVILACIFVLLAIFTFKGKEKA